MTIMLLWLLCCCVRMNMLLSPLWFSVREQQGSNNLQFMLLWWAHLTSCWQKMTHFLEKREEVHCAEIIVVSCQSNRCTMYNNVQCTVYSTMSTSKDESTATTRTLSKTLKRSELFVATLIYLTLKKPFNVSRIGQYLCWLCCLSSSMR